DLLGELGRRDREFDASMSLLFSRPPDELPADHELPRGLQAAATAAGATASTMGMSIWADAAILGDVRIPSALCAPGGPRLHSLEESVNVADVLACGDALALLAMDWL